MELRRGFVKKNLRTVYVVNVNEKLGLSPGKETGQLREAKERVRATKAKTAVIVEAKKGDCLLPKKGLGKILLHKDMRE